MPFLLVLLLQNLHLALEVDMLVLTEQDFIHLHWRHWFVLKISCGLTSKVDIVFKFFKYVSLILSWYFTKNLVLVCFIAMAEILTLNHEDTDVDPSLVGLVSYFIYIYVNVSFYFFVTGAICSWARRLGVTCDWARRSRENYSCIMLDFCQCCIM